jgi:peptidyl-tRNA hydrolase, PTH1 family
VARLRVARNPAELAGLHDPGEVPVSKANWRERAFWRRGQAGKNENDAHMDASDRWLIVGLGNPGPQYAGNRHNVGFLCCDELTADVGATFKRDKSRAFAATGTLAGTPVVLAKPMSFMNVSGGPVAGLRNFYKIPLDRIVVVHDELDLPFGTVRLKLGGGDNGHNGLRSVTTSLGSRDYYRVRIGIGRPPGRMDPADFVLRDFSAAERKDVPEILGRAADSVRLLLGHGLAVAQNEIH